MTRQVPCDRHALPLRPLPPARWVRPRRRGRGRAGLSGLLAAAQPGRGSPAGAPAAAGAARMGRAGLRCWRRPRPARGPGGQRWAGRLARRCLTRAAERRFRNSQDKCGGRPGAARAPGCKRRAPIAAPQARRTGSWTTGTAACADCTSGVEVRNLNDPAAVGVRPARAGPYHRQAPVTRLPRPAGRGRAAGTMATQHTLPGPSSVAGAHFHAANAENIDPITGLLSTSGKAAKGKDQRAPLADLTHLYASQVGARWRRPAARARHRRSTNRRRSPADAPRPSAGSSRFNCRADGAAAHGEGAPGPAATPARALSMPSAAAAPPMRPCGVPWAGACPMPPNGTRIHAIARPPAQAGPLQGLFGASAAASKGTGEPRGRA
jgi:hypothetical protein